MLRDSVSNLTVAEHSKYSVHEDPSTGQLKAALLKDIHRSAYVYRVDCGGCNGCEIEIFAALTPLFDVERFGIKVVSSPRHADILLYTGTMTRSMRVPASEPITPRLNRRFVWLMAPADAPAAFSMISTVSGAGRISSFPLMCIFPAVLQLPQPPFTALRLVSDSSGRS